MAYKIIVSVCSVVFILLAIFYALSSRNKKKAANDDTLPDLERQQNGIYYTGDTQRHNRNTNYVVADSTIQGPSNPAMPNSTDFTVRNQNRLTQSEIDMLLPAQKLKDVSFFTAENERLSVSGSGQKGQPTQTAISNNESLKTFEKGENISNNSNNINEKDITDVQIISEDNTKQKVDDAICVSKSSSISVSDITCAICHAVIGKENVKDCNLSQAERDEQVQVRVLSCNHCFHDDCISKWLLEQAVCPLCNRRIVFTMM